MSRTPRARSRRPRSRCPGSAARRRRGSSAPTYHRREQHEQGRGREDDGGARRRRRVGSTAPASTPCTIIRSTRKPPTTSAKRTAAAPISCTVMRAYAAVRCGAFAIARTPPGASGPARARQRTRRSARRSRRERVVLREARVEPERPACRDRERAECSAGAPRRTTGPGRTPRRGDGRTRRRRNRRRAPPGSRRERAHATDRFARVTESPVRGVRGHEEHGCGDTEAGRPSEIDAIDADAGCRFGYRLALSARDSPRWPPHLGPGTRRRSGASAGPRARDAHSCAIRAGIRTIRPHSVAPGRN